MAQTLLHREEHIDVAASLDVDDAVWMEPGQVKGGGEEIAPAKTPENRAFYARENSGEKDGRARLISQITTARDLMERATGYPAAGKTTIDTLEAKGNDVVLPIRALNLRNART